MKKELGGRILKEDMLNFLVNTNSDDANYHIKYETFKDTLYFDDAIRKFEYLKEDSEKISENHIPIVIVKLSQYVVYNMGFEEEYEENDIKIVFEYEGEYYNCEFPIKFFDQEKISFSEMKIWLYKIDIRKNKYLEKIEKGKIYEIAIKSIQKYYEMNRLKWIFEK